jgi:hypothetical protein
MGGAPLPDGARLLGRDGFCSDASDVSAVSEVDSSDESVVGITSERELQPEKSTLESSIARPQKHRLEGRPVITVAPV